MATHDIVLRGGLVFDGSGAEPREMDVAVDGGTISHLGKVSGKGREEIDARGQIVTPGFVDIHTHYDGQATWGSEISPSRHHERGHGQLRCRLRAVPDAGP